METAGSKSRRVVRKRPAQAGEPDGDEPPLKKRPAGIASGDGAGFELLPWPEDCVCSMDGDWLLSPRDGSYTPAGPSRGPKFRNGSYKFLRAKQQLISESKHLIARIAYQPIGEGVTEKGGKIVPTVMRSEIIKEIQDPANDGAFFVLPSQLNGAEYISNTDPCDMVGHYLWDNTAGPRGQLALHPGLAQFLLDSAARDGKPDGIDVTRGLFKAMNPSQQRGLVCQNGYLRVPRWPADEDFAAVAESMEEALPHLCSLVALDGVVAGLGPSLTKWAECGHRVNIAYASAVPVNAYNNPAATEVTAKRQQHISSLLMRGAYYGALKLALERHMQAKENKETADEPEKKRTRVFFMPLGGGVFNNRPQAIADAMTRALEAAQALCSDKLEEHLDVRVLTWEGKPAEGSLFSSLFPPQP